MVPPAHRNSVRVSNLTAEAERLMAAEAERLMAAEAERLMAADALLPKSKTESVGIMLSGRKWLFSEMFL